MSADLLSDELFDESLCFLEISFPPPIGEHPLGHVQKDARMAVPTLRCNLPESPASRFVPSKANPFRGIKKLSKNWQGIW